MSVNTAQQCKLNRKIMTMTLMDLQEVGKMMRACNRGIWIPTDYRLSWQK